MTNKEAVLKIQELLGLGKFSFATAVTEEGVELRTEEFEVGMPIYVVTEAEGEKPCPDGKYQMADMEVEVEEGLIKSIEMAPVEMEEEVSEEVSEEMEEEVVEEAMEEEVSEEEEKFVEANLVDGTLVSTEDAPFEVGSKLYVISEEGRSAAPAGKHITSTGYEVEVNEEGVIVAIEPVLEAETEETVEEELGYDKKEEMTSEVVETFTAAIEEISKQLAELREENKSLRENFSKFSNKEAGEPIKAPKAFRLEDTIDYVSKLDRLSSFRNKK